MSVFNRMLNGSQRCTDLLACVYELNRLESQAYFRLLEDEGLSLDDLAGLLDRERSTVHRAVQKLLNVQLAERETVPLKGGGYYYRYRATSPETVRARIERRLDDFQAAVEQALDAFEDEVATHSLPSTEIQTSGTELRT